MIASLTGLIASTDDRSCIIEVGGVGYLVHASSRTLASLPPPPAVARLIVETELRPDAILLYGFTDASERAWFRLLTTVQGVGARLALAILSALSPVELAQAVATGDRGWLMRAPGVGAKLAQRLVGELRDPAARLSTLHAPLPPRSGVATDAISALVNLGYRRSEVEAALARAGARLGVAVPFATLVREGLKELAQ